MDEERGQQLAGNLRTLVEWDANNPVFFEGGTRCLFVLMGRSLPAPIEAETGQIERGEHE